MYLRLLQDLQGKLMGFHDLFLTLNSKKDSHSCISWGKISQFLILNTRCFIRASKFAERLNIRKI